mgnify:CR=1 FL=1
MTRITRISRLRNCGVFRDFTWPDELLEFGRYNLIYGWNGAGKTTLSRLFRDLELRRCPAMGEVRLETHSGSVRGQDFPQPTLPIRVFNCDFIHESVLSVRDGDVPPIFVIGTESVEKQKEVDRLRAELRAKEDQRNKAREHLKQAETALDKHCIDCAKVIKDTLRASGSAYNEYDKRRYKEGAEKMAETADASTHRLSDSERDSLLAQHRATPKSTLKEIAYRLPNLQELAGGVAELLETTVVSAAIQALKDDAALAEWTRHGLGLHKERKSDRCLFCEQPLPEDHLSQLEAHFNAEYEQFLQTVEDQIQRLESAEKQAAGVRLPSRAELYDHLVKDFDAAQLALQQALDAVQTFLGELINELKGKRAKPFEAQTLNVSVPCVDVAVVERLNEVICRHNHACNDFTQRARTARDRMALAMIAENRDEFVRLRAAAQAALANVERLDQEIKELDDQIARLERDIRQHQRPAEELNEDLKRYLGHGDLQFTIKETGYAITRNGVPADRLSEGEMTAIALLYFLKSLEDRSFDKANGVVVLDDPVSSLDANALYLAFGLIRERTQGAGQLFIFTHNFAFFRQVRNWFKHLKGQNKRDPSKRPARFYMLDCVQGQDGRCAGIRWLDPLLEQYNSEYHYLFACVHRAASTSEKADLEKNYALPNIARRLLEAFLAFRQPEIVGELSQKLGKVKFDEAKKLRIARFVHTHSHGDSVGEPEHDPSLLGEAPSVLADLMDLVKSEDPQHFAAMERLLATPAEEAEAE